MRGGARARAPPRPYGVCVMRTPSSWAVPLGLLAIAACGGSGVLPPVDEAPATPALGVLFDASAGSSAGILLPYTPAGILLDTGPGGSACPPATHVAPGGVVILAPSVEHASFPVRLGGAFAKATREPPVVDPAVVEGLENDCDILAEFDAVHAHLDAACIEAEIMVEDLERCLAAAEDLYCDVVRKVEAAETLEFRVRIESFPTMFGNGRCGRSIPRTSVGSCVRFLFELLLLPGTLNGMRFEQARCEDTLAGLNRVLDLTGEAHTEGQKRIRLVVADRHLQDARDAHQRGLQLQVEVEETKRLFVRADLEASCAPCGPQVVFDPPPAAGGVVHRLHAESLQRATAALDEAAAQASDSQARQQYEELARRIAGIPDDRVHHVTYAGRLRVGVELLALADDSVPGDDTAPLLVVLTVLPADADLPTPDASDLLVLYEAYRWFVELAEPPR